MREEERQELRRKVEAAAFTCCGNMKTAGEYMGSVQRVCCDEPNETENDVTVPAADVLFLLQENDRLRQGLAGDYDLDKWLDFVVYKNALVTALQRVYSVASTSPKTHNMLAIERAALDGMQAEAPDFTRAPAGRQRIPAGLYQELEALRELRNRLSGYAGRFLKDEIEDRDACISDEQHAGAAALAEALKEAISREWSSVVRVESRMLGAIDAGDATANTVTVKLATPGDWIAMPLGSEVELVVTKLQDLGAKR